MHAHSYTLIEFDGRVFGPGVFECTPGEYHALAQRGPCRPATQAEIAAQAAPVESASVSPAAETAAVPPRPERKTRAPRA